MRIDNLRQSLRDFGAKPAHEARILRAWLQGRALADGPRRAEDVLPAAVRAALPDLTGELDALARVQAEHPGADGSVRLLVALADGQTVESVLLPRDGVCVSTQVGCAVGCTFCMTGKDGLLRQLSSTEIVAQVVLARRRRAVKKVVFMGMGEPAHNLDNVFAAIDLLGREGGIGHKNLVFSTVGDRRVFERLESLTVGDVRPALALSLHTTDASLRTRLLPRAPQIGIEEMVTRAEAWARQSGYPIQYQWTLLDGINDGAADVDGIVRLLAGKYAVMNLIPWNSNEGFGFRRPDPDRIAAMAAALQQRGILTKLRNSAGQDIDGGCGQLRARTAPPPRRPAARGAALDLVIRPITE